MIYTDTVICLACNGSGEGRHEGSVCPDCNGEGEFEQEFEEPDEVVVYKVKHYSWAGCSYPVEEFETYDEVKQYVADWLRRLQVSGYPVQELDEDYWEIGEPDDCVLVPAVCGTVRIVEVTK